MVLDYLDSGVAGAAENMAIDQALLSGLNAQSQPLLHAYSWRGHCATYGYFCQPSVWIDEVAARQLGVELARRPTGGGITLHLSDLAFSFLLPAHHPAFSLCTLDNYAFVNQAVAAAILRWRGKDAFPSLQANDSTPLSDGCRHFCMARPTQYDLVIAERKVGGAAQRRTRCGYLHQGTVALAWPEETLLRPLLRDEGVWQAMQSYSLPLLGYASAQELLEARSALMQALRTSLQEALSIS